MMSMKKIIIRDIFYFLVLFSICFVLAYYDDHFPLIISIIVSSIVPIITIIFVELSFYFINNSTSFLFLPKYHFKTT